MNFDEIVQHTRAMARRLKLNCLEDPESSDDIPTVVEVYRDGDVAAVLMWSSANDSSALDQVAAAGFAPDVLTVVSDTWFAGGEPSAPTGRPSGGADLGALAADPATRAQGLVYEGLLVVAADRSSGQTVCEAMLYRRDGESLVWLDSAVLPADRSDYQRRADSMLAMLRSVPEPASSPSQVERARRDLQSLDEIQGFYAAGGGGEERLIHVSLFAEPGSPRHQGLRETMDRSAIGNPREFWATRESLDA